MSELVEEAPEVLPIIEEVDLTKYAETRYLSKNKTLKTIMSQIEKGQVTKDEEIYQLISTNNYQGFDAYIRAHPGRQEFFRILQQILLCEYSGVIDRKQVQNSLGIQQARWACDDENCAKLISNKTYPTLSYTIAAVDFIYWQDIPADIQSKILNELYDMIERRMYERSREQLNNALNNTIWYRVTDTKRNSGGSWQFSVPYYPIPETFREINLIACIHVPELIFGTLNSPTLTKYIMTYQKRPYICHLPESKGNLCNVHFVDQSIFSIWFHDFFHSKSGDCDPMYYGLNYQAKKIIKDWDDITEENIIERLSDPTSQLNALIDLAKTNPEVDKIFRSLNDNGLLLSEKNKPPSFGGKKRKGKTKRNTKGKSKSKRKRNTKRKKNTKHKRKY
jgi:hypothetical protein